MLQGQFQNLSAMTQAQPANEKMCKLQKKTIAPEDCFIKLLSLKSNCFKTASKTASKLKCFKTECFYFPFMLQIRYKKLQVCYKSASKGFLNP